ncbi:hypothetical protein CTK_C03130 [Clostridium tyrobutyricum]|nr:hypothetical protein CTK_C03130 [Clostridium tyrobutyricum]
MAPLAKVPWVAINIFLTFHTPSYSCNCFLIYTFLYSKYRANIF